MSKVEELLKDNKLTEKLSMAKLNDLLKKEEEDKKPSKADRKSTRLNSSHP